MTFKETDLLLNHLPGLAYRCDPYPPWKMHYVSRGVKDLCGYDPDDLVSERVSWGEIVHPGDLRWVDDAVSEATARLRAFDLIYRIIDRAGTLRWVHERGEAFTPAPHEAPVLVGFIMSVTLQDVATLGDATPMIADEAALRRGVEAEVLYRSGKSAMASLAATIGHELNQPLAAIANYSAALKRILPHDQRACEMTDAVQANALRAGDILRRLRSFVETGRPQMEPVECSEMILDAVKFATHGCEEAAIRMNLAGHALVLADRVQIQQVLVNLIRNACEAVDGQEDRYIWIETAVPSDSPVLLVTVRNNGPPIPKHMVGTIFEAGSSSKPGGMGIGLSISRTIIEAHGGRIWAEETGTGARLSFELPIWNASPD